MESESIVERVKFAILPYLNPDIGDREATKAARAAISALREPTEEMKEAGISAIGNPDVDMAFAEMIDAALK